MSPTDSTSLEHGASPPVASRRGRLAGILHGLDGVTDPDDRPLRRRELAEERTVVLDGIRCTDGLQTLVDLAAELDDREWEHTLESALRKRLTSIAEIEAALPELGRSRTPGVAAHAPRAARSVPSERRRPRACSRR